MDRARPRRAIALEWTQVVEQPVPVRPSRGQRLRDAARQLRSRAPVARLVVDGRVFDVSQCEITRERESVDVTCLGEPMPRRLATGLTRTRIRLTWIADGSDGLDLLYSMRDRARFEYDDRAIDVHIVRVDVVGSTDGLSHANVELESVDLGL